MKRCTVHSLPRPYAPLPPVPRPLLLSHTGSQTDYLPASLLPHVANLPVSFTLSLSVCVCVLYCTGIRVLVCVFVPTILSNFIHKSCSCICPPLSVFLCYYLSASQYGWVCMRACMCVCGCVCACARLFNCCDLRTNSKEDVVVVAGVDVDVVASAMRK